MQKRIVAAATALALSFAVSGGALACAMPAGAAGIEAGILDWVNAERGRKGLGKLRASSALSKAADAHACAMANEGKISHRTRGGKALGGRLSAVGYDFRSAVENVARSSRGGAEAAARIWAASAPHMRNVLDRSTREAGIGLAVEGNIVYYVFIGGSR